MIVIDSVFIAWINYMGGIDVIHNVLSFLFIFVIIHVLFKITT